MVALCNYFFPFYYIFLYRSNQCVDNSHLWHFVTSFPFFFSCCDILICHFLGIQLISMQIRLVPLCPVTSSCHPFSLLFPLLSIVICSGSSLVICLLTVRQVDSRPLFTHRAFLHIKMHFSEERFDSKLHQHAYPFAILFLSLEQRGWGENEGWSRDDTVAHECHIIYQSVTHHHPASTRDAVDL